MTLVAEISPYVTAAVGAYGGAVLARAQEDAADATVEWGRKILQRIFGITDAPEETPETVADLVSDPGNEDFQAALRVRIAKMLAADAALVQEVRGMLVQAATSTVTVTASGSRSIAAHTNSGVAITGDNNTIHR
ncbi:hypothetical protein ABZV14_26190 [Streptosporangium canum]|uniref:hypothetical protein n=1 Tax=Streptosporangium canum TaxID=324952 RepID=UPI0033A9704E